MSKLPPQKIQIFCVILALFTASIACNLPHQDTVEKAVMAPEDQIAEILVEDVFHDDCSAVDRSEYERCAASLGVKPETPKYPEGATYSACYGSDGLYRVYMDDGPEPEESQITEQEEGNSLSPSTDADESNSISTDHYIGSSNYPDVLAIGFSSGQYPKNEISIHVADDGTVSGSYLMSFIGDPSTYNLDEEACTEQWDLDVNGTFSGQLTGSEGTITLEEDWVCTANSICRDDVDPNSCPLDEPFTREFKILINDDTMSGTTVPLPGDDPFMWEFSAIKQ